MNKSSSGEENVLEYVRRLKNLVKQHEDWRERRTLNLIASENFASLDARSFLSGDLSNRYTARDHFYMGTKFTDQVELLAVDLAKKLYRAKYADVRPLSGHTCSLILFLSFLKSQDKVVTCPPKFGGYPGSSNLGLGGLLGLRNMYFPYDGKTMNIIPYATRKMIERERPRMTVFGSSFIPFPYDIEDSLPQRYGGITVYDGSHVMGLIAGGKFQKPLNEGCSVLMGSTHKSFFGPQGGLILSNDEEVFSTIDSKVYPGIVDNIHWNRVASLCYSLLELIKFGSKYASQVVKNSKSLARSLDDLKIPVKCKEYGFTESHQVLLGYDEAKSKQVAKRLEQLDIITDTGIRLGTSEVTRRGMREPQMEEIAQLVSDSLSGRSQSSSYDAIRRRVHKLTGEFSGVEFTFAE